MAKNVYGSGTLEFELDGETFELTASPRAMKTVNNQFRGFAGAFEAVQRMDVEAIEIILAAGLPRADAKDLDQKIFKAGLSNVVAPAIKLLVALQNGGTFPDDEDEKTEDKEETPSPRKSRKATETPES